ncbi:hypothetical protein, partial [Mitsuaria sp. GD03876]|uniref:hypothetical protein n=1 Tax=Mitsuaria sp. GD03876 TaxID=2975399 RepID=UPI00244B5760
AALPLSRAGWTLQRIACRGGAGCVATWARHHGTLAQLDAAATTALVIDREPGADRLAMPMREALAVRAPGDAPAPALRAGALPPLRDAVVDWGSRLQDLMLVGGGQATLDTGTALEPPGSGHPAAVAPDVLRLGWRLRDGLWSLPFLQLPPYVVADSLVVTLGATHITYELSGSLFALGPSP